MLSIIINFGKIRRDAPITLAMDGLLLLMESPEAIKTNLKAWKTMGPNELLAEIKSAEKRLLDIQRLVEMDNVEAASQEKHAKDQLISRQKSHAKWMFEGVPDTKFFQAPF